MVNFKIILILLIQISLIFCFNCALFQKKNLRLTNAVEENLIPEDNTIAILTAPIYIPVGITAGILDVFVVHPIAVIPDAAEDTLNALWKSQNSGYYTKMGAVPFSILATPPFFVMSWTYHWFFNKGQYHYQSGIKTSKKEIQFDDWKLAMKVSISDQDINKLYANYKIHDKFSNQPDTVSILIDARENLAKKKSKTEEWNLLNEILKYPSTNEEVRNYVLKELLNSKSPSGFLKFIHKCKHVECRKSLLKKIQTSETSSYNLSEMIRIYFDIATQAEKEKFMKQLQAIE